MKGNDKWANDGLQKLRGHVTDEERALLNDNKDKMMLDSKMKNLLVTASNYDSGSKALDHIMKHLKNFLEKSNK